MPKGRIDDLLVVVPDANKVAAALISPTGFVSKEFQRGDVHFVAPAFLADEIDEHSAEYAKRIGVEQDEMESRTATVFSHVALVSAARLVKHAAHPNVVACEAVDPDDSPYVATVIEADADLLWTSDKAIRALFPAFAHPVIPRRVG